VARPVLWRQYCRIEKALFTTVCPLSTVVNCCRQWTVRHFDTSYCRIQCRLSDTVVYCRLLSDTVVNSAHSDWWSINRWWVWWGRRAGGACVAQGGWDGGARGPARARPDVAHDEERGASQAGDASRTCAGDHWHWQVVIVSDSRLHLRPWCRGRGRLWHLENASVSDKTLAGEYKLDWILSRMSATSSGTFFSAICRLINGSTLIHNVI